MADIRITDLVDEKVFEDLNSLSDKIKSLKQQYVEAATELAKGLTMKISTQGDLDKFNHLVAESSKKAQQATDQLNQSIDKQRDIISQTTNTISRELAEIEKENKSKREAFVQDKSALDIAQSLLGTRQQNIQRLATLQMHLKEVKNAQKELDDQEKSGVINAERASAVRAELIAKQREYQAAIKDLNLVLNNQEKQMQASEGSYQKLSLQLEMLKRAYKGLNDEEKESDMGKKLGEEIGNLDAHLKDLAADMGEFQRNTGNYAIANQNVKTELRELVQEIALLTIQYRNMSDEEKNSAQGRELEQKMHEMTAKAAELKDAIGDVSREIQSGANDTNTFSAFSEGINVVISGVGGLTAACHALGIGERDLIKIQTNLQAAMAASNAMTKAQNALQKESNLMVGVARIQANAHAMAIKMKTIAEGEGVVATKAATVAQAAFNAVARANPYVILATGIGLLIAAVVGLTKATKSETEEQRKFREETEKAKREYEDFIDIEKRLQEAREKGIESSADEIAKLTVLYSVATDVSRSVDERRIAVNKLQELYPDYLGNIEDEEIMSGKAEGAIRSLTSAIYDKAVAMAKMKMMEEYTETQLKKDKELKETMEAQAEAQERLTKARKEYEDKVGTHSSITTQAYGTAGVTMGQLGDSDEKRRIANEFKEAQEEVDGLNDKVVQLAKETQDAAEAAKKMTDELSKADIEAIASGGSKTKSSSSTPAKTEKQEITKTYEEIKEITLEHTQEIIAERIKMTEKGSKEEYDLTVQYIEIEQQLREISIKKSYEKDKKALDEALKNKTVSQEEYYDSIEKLEEARGEMIALSSQRSVKAMEKAQEEYKTSQTDLQDFLYEHEIEVREQALDKLKEDTDKSYQDQIDKIQEFLNNEVAMYREACSMIDNDNGTLYGKLLEYCLNYTTTGRAEFDHMWTEAKSAMDRYNTANLSTIDLINDLQGRIYDVDSAIDTLTTNIETYENRISNLKNQIDNLKDAAIEAKNAIDIANSTPLTPKTQNNNQTQDNNAMRYIGRGYDASRGKYYYKVSYRGRDYWSYVGDSSDTDRVRNLAALGISKEIAKYHSGFDTYGLSQVQHALKVNVKNIGHYAKGTKSATGGLHIVDEEGLFSEFIPYQIGKGRYSFLPEGNPVFSKAMTNTLFDFAKDPREFVNSNSPNSNESISGDITVANYIYGDVDEQMLKRLEKKEKDIVSKAKDEVIETVLKGRKWR